MTTTVIPLTISDEAISLVINNVPKIIPIMTNGKRNTFIDAIIQAVKENDEQAVLELIDRAEAIRKYSGGSVEIRDGSVYYKGSILNNAIVPKLIQMFELGLDVSPWVKFVEKLMKNPSFSSKEQLYRFVEANNVPINKDGDLVLWKWVNNDYTDCHTGRIDNSVGAVVEMERSEVDDDPNRTCSAGLHVCSKNYTRFGTRLMYVAVSPEDVVSVPTDYQNSKMRTCKYTVISEAEDINDYEGKSFDDTPVYNFYTSAHDEVDDYADDDDDDDWDEEYGFDFDITT